MSKPHRPRPAPAPSPLIERIVARLARLGWLALDGGQLLREARRQSRAALRMARGL